MTALAVVLWSVAVSWHGPIAGAAPPAGFVTRDGTHLMLDGQPFVFTGLNIYNANSDGWCGTQMDSGPALDDALTAMGPGKEVIRAWFFQPLAINKDTGERDWSGFDHTLSVAAAHGMKVIATLTDQWGECGTDVDGNGYKTADWYVNGYRQVQPGMLDSYRDWVAEVVNRYKDDPRIAFWQLINEAEVTPCSPGDTQPYQTLHDWAADVSGLIKSIDPNHLVSLGTIGSGQCGAVGQQYEDLHAIPTIDLCEYHDYGSPGVGIPGDQFNGLQLRIDQCDALDKPLFVGEAGIVPDDVGGTLADRADAFQAKIDAQFAAGVQGFLAWAWSPQDPPVSTLDNYDIGPGDPALDSLVGAPPGLPTAVGALPGTGQATVSWTAPAFDGGSAITSYTVTSAPGGEQATVGPGQTSATVTGLTNGTAYTFTVVATNAVADGPPSAPSDAVIPATPPGPPTGVVAVPGNELANVTWLAPASDGGSAITGYTVTSTPGGLSTTVDGFTLSAAVTGLTNGTSYRFRVTAANPVASGPRSAQSNAVVPRTVPGAPTGVSATPGNAKASVTWTVPASNGGSKVTSYTVTASPGGRHTTVKASATAANVTGLTNGTSYSFTVVATNAAGAGSPSAPSAPATPRKPPGAPTSITAVAGSARATVTWKTPKSDGGSAITSYTVISNPGGSSATVAGSTLSAVVTGLTNGTRYRFRVTAANAAGSGPQSAQSNAVTPHAGMAGARAAAELRDRPMR